MTRSRWLAPLLLVLLQTIISLPRLNRWFVEGRAHWHYDSTLFLLRAVHCADRTIADPRKVFGVSKYVYGDKGPERLEHYNHHPLLPTLLFRGYTSLVGFGHWAPRSFALIFSLLITALLFELLFEATRKAWVAAALTLLYILLPLNYNYQDAWKHEIVVTFMMLLTVLLSLRFGRGPRWRAAFCGAFFLLFQAGWAAYAFGAGTWLYVWRRFTAPKQRRAALWAAFAGAVGIAANLLALYWLGFDWHAIRGQAGYRMAAGMADVGWWRWALRQADYLAGNLSGVNMAALAVLAAWRAARPPKPAEALSWFGALLLLTAAAWVCVFRNLSWSINYHQWYFGPAYILLLGGAVAAPPRGTPRVSREAAWAACAGLLLAAFLRAGAVERSIHEGDFASREDMVALSAQTRRLLPSRLGPSGPRDWWISPNIELYTDPVYKRAALGLPAERIRGSFAFLEDVAAVDRDGDMIVTLNEPGAVDALGKTLKGLGITRLRVESRSPRFIFWRPA